MLSSLLPFFLPLSLSSLSPPFSSDWEQRKRLAVRAEVRRRSPRSGKWSTGCPGEASSRPTTSVWQTNRLARARAWFAGEEDDVVGAEPRG
uniref:Secreted protein n=1 Tax=Oryza glaberrima TaxID=4538 RepID=I1QSW4_ORYGL